MDKRGLRPYLYTLGLRPSTAFANPEDNPQDKVHPKFNLLYKDICLGFGFALLGLRPMRMQPPGGGILQGGEGKNNTTNIGGKKNLMLAARFDNTGLESSQTFMALSLIQKVNSDPFLVSNYFSCYK
jgi:hypothetical protein